MVYVTALKGERRRDSPTGRNKHSNMWTCKLAALLFGLMASIGSGFTLQAQLKPDPTVASVTEKSKEIAPFNTQDRLRFYEETTVTPLAFVGPVGGAAMTQWITGNPPEWGQGFQGYGRRLLAGYSRQVVASTVGLGVMFADREDPRHYPTGRHGVWKRGLYAARQAFVSHRSSGGEMPAYSRIFGLYAAGFAANAWYPARSSNVHSALYRGTTAFASNVGWQEFKEFWPDVRRKLSHR